jgi:hypothetical protein
MKKYNTVFKRYEKKYLLSEEQYAAFLEIAERYMQVDEYGESTICNIYFDTDNYELVRNSIEKPVYKEKLRMRSYVIPKKDDTVFLEIKKKYQGIVYKRRIALPLEEAYAGLEKGEIAPEKGQIAREINYFLQKYRPSPRVYLAYDRIAMYGKEDAELRMTFDFRIRSRMDELDLMSGDSGELLLPDGQVVLEVKVADAYPMWLIQALEELSVYPCSFSKYGNVYKNELPKSGIRTTI